METASQEEAMASQEWRMDRTIPASTLFALLVNIILLVWIVSKYDSRLGELEKWRNAIEVEAKASNDTLNTKLTSLEKNTAVTDTKVDAMIGAIRNLEQKIDVLKERGR